MKKKVIVISLGGSLIIPEQIDVRVLREFKRILFRNKYRYKFVIVCGGGSTARNYIKGLKDEDFKQNKKELIRIIVVRKMYSRIINRTNQNMKIVFINF